MWSRIVLLMAAVLMVAGCVTQIDVRTYYEGPEGYLTSSEKYARAAKEPMVALERQAFLRSLNSGVAEVAERRLRSASRYRDPVCGAVRRRGVVVVLCIPRSVLHRGHATLVFTLQRRGAYGLEAPLYLYLPRRYRW